MTGHSRLPSRLLLLLLAAVSALLLRSPHAWLSPRGNPSHAVTTSRRMGTRASLARRALSHGSRIEDPEDMPRRPLAAGIATMLLNAVAAFAVLSRPKVARAETEVDIYFGAGNFWHLQHEFVLKEALDLQRREGDLTSVAGYAGGTRVGELDRVCFNGLAFAPDHVSLGHAQVVRVTLPVDSITDFTRTFADNVEKRKPSEKGSQYRAVIGLRGGVKSKYFPVIEDACKGRLKLVEGKGDEKDNFGENTVYVYNDRTFPCRPAEVSNQFRNDPPDIFDQDYTALNGKLQKAGIILRSGCPTEG
eukprot:TRINITY_DN111576_c0_g1_i1.p1 TRINITY_DN111576_c0_g1~~TRINITY_DN111576_c0_g1_i1.p1  ORF type:complete len:304 (-),score=47.42 TRINITY_DN111576_c0_g1_i1:40-951(-)